MFRRQKLSKKGFTLIEVVLAITILSTLSILVATATTRALKAKRKIQAEVEDVSALRDTMKVLRADLYQAYHHFDFEKAIFDQVSKAKTNTPAAGQVPGQQPPVQRENTREDPKTEFVGEQNKIDFVTMNNGRQLASDLQADFVEVGYSLKQCRNLSDESKNSNCLYRRVQKLLDKDVTKGGIETVILENVTEFTLRYIGEGKLDWANEWKTSGGIDDTTKNTFPEAVEISLAIERELDKKSRKYSLQYVVPIHFPNNVKSNSTSGAAPGTTAPPPPI